MAQPVARELRGSRVQHILGKVGALTTPRILVVKGEQGISPDIQAQLESLGYMMTALAVGEAAVPTVQALKPDLVLTDVELDGRVDGVQVGEQIHAQLDIPVVYAVTHSGLSILRQAEIVEPFRYLLRPFDEREFRATIEMALYTNQLEKELGASTTRCHEISEPVSDFAFLSADRAGRKTGA